METLLPSEVARLVFGYLEDEKCDDAATSFLKASPHLQECRMVLSSGRRFNKRVNGCTLVDILEKFSAVHALVQERLSKVPDCDQVRNCADLLDQLRFLIDGSRAQRFVVNINVPSQASSQTHSGSPVISSSIHRKYHSAGERDRNKRTPKSLNEIFDKNSEPATSHSLGCDTVKATPLESLPGQTNLSLPLPRKSIDSQENEGVHCTLTKADSTECTPLRDFTIFQKAMRRSSSTSQHGNEPENSSEKSIPYSPILTAETEATNKKNVEDQTNAEAILKAKTTATSTDELTTYSSIEVQTTPYALLENEWTDEPIENLSLLTKELLNRTELHEKIAENINKVLPMDVTSKDDSLADYMGGELNTSVMSELNNAIKSIVAATETDPVFENFLDEIIGPHAETDTSPDEDVEIKLPAEGTTDAKIEERPSHPVAMDVETEGENIASKKSDSLLKTTEVPLKQRLRSSSRQQNQKPEGDRLNEFEQNENSLDNLNAAAILSIINVNITADVGNKASDKSINAENQTKPDASTEEPIASHPDNQSSRSVSVTSADQTVENVQIIDENGASNLKNTNEKPAEAESMSTTKESEIEVTTGVEFISEREMMAMPTLIVCSNEGVIPMHPVLSRTTSSSANRFIPIAPKGISGDDPGRPSLYLKAVHVPINVTCPVIKRPFLLPKESRESKTSPGLDELKKTRPDVVPSDESNEATSTCTDNANLAVPESITFYTNDNSIGTLIETSHMPSINLDESITFTGTGLSPYLKFGNTQLPELPDSHESGIDAPTNQAPSTSVPAKDAANNLTEPEPVSCAESILISRRTPKSLLKSRSKNNRLSMSTPRRRSSHIRALDFSTPMKNSKSEIKMSGQKIQFSPKSSKRARSVCRTSLFKSPPFSNPVNTTPKRKSPVQQSRRYNVPIATRSPAPKLIGGWDKYTGVGMIIGDADSHPVSSFETSGQEEPSSVVKNSAKVKKSWDADLRRAVKECEQSGPSTTAAKDQSCKVKTGRISKSGTKGVAKSIKKQVVADPSKQRKTGKQPAAKKSDDSPEENVNREIDKPVDTRSVPRKDDIPGEKCSKIETGTAQSIDLPEVDGQSITGTSKSSRPVKPNDNLDSKGRPITSTMVKAAKDHTKVSTSAKSINPANKTSSTTTNNVGVDTRKPLVKKYAQLKTLNTKVSRNLGKKAENNVSSGFGESSQKSHDDLKISPETGQRSQNVQASRCMDLVTPRKFEDSLGIPPTPRLLSPSNSTTTPFIRMSEESSKVAGSFVRTPEFPPTPGIGMTPKVIGEDTTDAMKHGNFATCSPYYEPSNEQGNILEKITATSDQSKADGTELGAQIRSGSVDCRTTKTTGTEFVTTASSSRQEITQFEVIKENLSKEEAVKELKLTPNSTETVQGMSIARHCETTEVLKTNISISRIQNPSFDDSFVHLTDDSSSGNESSDSSSSDTSSSSSSSSSSCSSDEDTPVSLVTATNVEDVAENNDNLEAQEVRVVPMIDPASTTKSKVDAAIESAAAALVERTHESPSKVFPILKTQEEDEASAKETPAKDEALLSEANISETPSSSKCGIETLTNLNSKISAFNSPEEPSTSRTSQSFAKMKPRVTKIQRIRSEVEIPKQQLPVSESITTSLPTNFKIIGDNKPAISLEDKRQQVITAITSNQPPRKMLQRPKAGPSVARETKISVDDQNRLPSVQRQKRVPGQTLVSAKSKLPILMKGRKLAMEPKSTSRLSNRPKIRPCTMSLSTKNIVMHDKKEKCIAENANVNDTRHKSENPAKSGNSMEEGDKIVGDRDQTNCAVQRTARKNQIVLASKVDQIKRDLFSDEEPNDQRTTRSRTRLLTDSQKHEMPVPDQSSTSKIPADPRIEKPEELTNVLECLQLVPATKHDTAEKVNTSIDHGRKNQVEYHIVYESTDMPLKKRKAKSTPSDFKYPVHLALGPDDEQRLVINLRSSEMIDIFEKPPKVSSKPNRKNIRKIAVQNESKRDVERHKITATPASDDGSMKPLATSSPIVLPAERKLNPTTTKIVQESLKSTNKKDQKKTKGETKDSKKRDMPDCHEDQPEEKRRRITDPQSLLKKVDLDSFLNSVHGPV